jgi:hypothetical protein
MKMPRLIMLASLAVRILRLFFYKFPRAIKNFSVGLIQTKFRKHQCNICEYRGVEFIYATWFNYFLRCPKCNTYFVSNLPEIGKIRQDFAISDNEEYWLKRGRFVVSSEHCEKDWQGWVDWKVQTFEKLKLEDFENELGSSREALEIGCAEGKILEILRSRKWKTVGLDISEYEAQLCRRLGFDVIVAAAEETNFRDKSFDLVVMFHTLEHATNPARVIKNINSVLRNGGRLILELPYFNSRKRFFEDFNNICHFYFLSEKGVEEILKKPDSLVWINLSTKTRCIDQNAIFAI